VLDLFGVPEPCLPSINASCDRTVVLDGHRTVVATVADQAAATLAAIGERTDAVLINLGTGGFVMRPIGKTMTMVDGYLCGPLFATKDRSLFALEGTINGGGGVIDRFAAPPTDLPMSDIAPDAFALPDEAGIGAPHWRPDRSLTLSRAAERLDPMGQRRTIAEGLVFRVREILDDLNAGQAPSTVCLSGGLGRDPFFAAALAALLGRSVELLEEGEQTLRGAAWLAAGRPSGSSPRLSRLVKPANEHRWLRDKYPRWKGWLDRVLAGVT
jgi:glycerol kinase